MVEGIVLETRRDEVRGVTSIVVEQAGGDKVSICGLGARFEDFEAKRIRVKALKS